MTWLDLVVLSLVTYRATRFMQLDSMIKEPRDAIAKWLLKGPTYRDENHKVWPFSYWRRKALEWMGCPFCQSVWVAAGAYWFWWRWGDTVGGRFVLAWLAVSGAAMIVYRFVDPPKDEPKK